MAAVIAQAALTAGLLGGLSMAISAFTRRRAYAVAAIIAVFVIPPIVAGIVAGLGSDEIGTWLVLLSPASILDGTNAFLFDVATSLQFDSVDVPEVSFFIAAAAGIVGSIAIAVRRFQGLTA